MTKYQSLMEKSEAEERLAIKFAQKKYFRTRSQSAMTESKSYEKEVDRILEERQKRETERQNPGLF